MQIPRVVAVSACLSLALASAAVAEPERRRSEREERFSREEIGDAIQDAVESSTAVDVAVTEMTEDGPQDARKRREELTAEVDELVQAIARLREDFDADDSWEDQRAEVRLAYSQWRKLDRKFVAHWAREAKDEMRDLHRDLRRLVRIYQVDSPART